MRKRSIILVIAVILTIIAGCGGSKNNKDIDISELTIGQIHMSYEKGDYTSTDLVKAYLKQIEKYNSQINAVTTVNPEAILIAEALDAEFLLTGKLRPLHGIPLLVKDNINTRGLPTTAGSLALRDFIPSGDAFIINKLVEAGAIIIAKTNMAEWAFSPMHTESSTAGVTRNPYNLLHVPAGSSGGTAAGIAANFATIGLGTDTGNSIRGPSSHCSLVGFRTTMGLVSRSGIVPLYLRNDIVGPMCRTVEDAVKVLDVIAGYDPLDPVTKRSEGIVPESYSVYLEKDGLKGTRIGVLRELIDESADPEIVELFNNALADMEAMGAIIIDPLIIPDFAKLRQNQWCAEFRTDLEAFLATYVKNDTLNTLEDIIRIGTKSEFADMRMKYQASNSGRSANKEIPCLDPYNDLLRIAFRESIEKVMDEKDLDAIVYPSWNNKPALIESFSEGYKGDNSQIIAPHTGQPAFTIPMGFTTGNMPAGIQLLGRMFDEGTLIKIGCAYEAGSNHRKAPRID